MELLEIEIFQLSSCQCLDRRVAVAASVRAPSAVDAMSRPSFQDRMWLLDTRWLVMMKREQQHETNTMKMVDGWLLDYAKRVEQMVQI